MSNTSTIHSPAEFERALQQESLQVADPVVPLAKGLKPRELTEGDFRTYKDLLRSGDKGARVVTSVDLSVPPGHFVTSTKISGLVTEYLIEGAEGDERGKIVGRIELAKSRGHVYRGNGLKGGTYIGQIGGGSDRSFADAFDDIAQKPEPLPKAPESTPAPLGGPRDAVPRAKNYDVMAYTAHRPEASRVVRTNGEFKKAIRQLRSEPNGAIRRVEVRFGKNHGYFGIDKPVVHGPKDGTPLVIDYAIGNMTSIDVAEGNVVINATGTYGGIVRVGRGASVTVITTGSKFKVEAEAGSAVTVFPRAGAWGSVYAEEGANVVIDDLYDHEIKLHVRSR